MSDQTEKPEWGTMTHNAMCRRMAAWVQNNQGYSVVVTELATRISETPDVIGFSGSASILIECKVSRSDFLADAKKLFRIYGEKGMGDLRYFAAPRGIINVPDLPEGWGLLEVSDRQVRKILDAAPQSANKPNEVAFLVSVLRRLQLSTAVYVRQEEVPEPSQALTP